MLLAASSLLVSPTDTFAAFTAPAGAGTQRPTLEISTTTWLPRSEPRGIERVHTGRPAPRHEVRRPPLQLVRSDRNCTVVACTKQLAAAHCRNEAHDTYAASNCQQSACFPF